MLTCVASNVFADNVLDSITGDDSTATDQIGSIGNKIVSVITNVAMVVAVVVIAVIGVKYMLGSAEEKAEYKKTLMPYLIGAILVFGAVAIGKAVVSIGTGIGAEATASSKTGEGTGN